MTRPVRITVKNYRCFSDVSPISLDIGPGLTAFVGPNNSGKSSALKLLYETQGIWNALSSPLYVAQQVGGTIGVAPRGVQDLADLACDVTDRPPNVLLQFPAEEAGGDAIRLELSSDMQFQNWQYQVWIGELGRHPQGHDDNGQFILAGDEGSRSVSASPIVEFGRWLRDAMYVGPFRNAVNAGAGAYYDMQVGSGLCSVVG